MEENSNTEDWGNGPAPIQQMTEEEAEAVRPGFAAFWRKATAMAELVQSMSAEWQAHHLPKLKAADEELHTAVLHIMGQLPEPCRLMRVVTKPTRKGLGILLWAPIGSHTRSTVVMPMRRPIERAWTFTRRA